ncbi:MAG: Holliday junction branch migration protein RuvA [Rhodospirillales bacterium]|nr:Holliday junction branch migration protein RuvA [Rhodospirillales bacterium]
MIARLAGRIVAIEDGRCIVDVHGVGYLVQASSRTLAALPAAPEEAVLLIETHVREDAILLFGFADAAERDFFRLLTTVQGVGAKLALAVLSALAPRDLVAAITAGDKAALARAPGVGARLAARLALELREKIGAVATGGGFVPTPPAASAEPASDPARDALSALLNLGYRRAEAEPVIARVAARLGDGAALSEVLRDSLKELARP